MTNIDPNLGPVLRSGARITNNDPELEGAKGQEKAKQPPKQDTPTLLDQGLKALADLKKYAAPVLGNLGEQIILRGQKAASDPKSGITNKEKEVLTSAGSMSRYAHTSGSENFAWGRIKDTLGPDDPIGRTAKKVMEYFQKKGTVA